MSRFVQGMPLLPDPWDNLSGWETDTPAAPRPQPTLRGTYNPAADTEQPSLRGAYNPLDEIFGPQVSPAPAPKPRPQPQPQTHTSALNRAIEDYVFNPAGDGLRALSDTFTSTSKGLWNAEPAAAAPPELRGTIAPEPAPPRAPDMSRDVQEISRAVASGVADPVAAGVRAMYDDFMETSYSLWGKGGQYRRGEESEFLKPFTIDEAWENPGLAAQKITAQFMRYSGIMAAGIAGAAVVAPAAAGTGLAGLAAAGASGAGVTGAAVGSGLATFMQVFGPNLTAELQRTPEDKDGAYERAETATAIDVGTAFASSYALLIGPFKSLFKNAMLQTFIVQPEAGVLSNRAHNLWTGDPNMPFADEYANMLAVGVAQAGVGTVTGITPGERDGARGDAARFGEGEPWTWSWKKRGDAYEFDPEVEAALPEYRPPGDAPPPAARNEGQQPPPGQTAMLQRGAGDNKPPEPFYYKSERLLNDINISRAAPGQWLSTFKNKGIREEELRDLHIQQFLETAKEPVTRDQLQALIDTNRAEFKEVTFGGAATDKVVDLWGAVRPDGHVDSTFDSQAAAQNRANELGGTVRLDRKTLNGTPPPKFASHVLPGGANYRELVLTLPRSAEMARSDEVVSRMHTVAEQIDAISEELNASVPNSPEQAAISARLVPLNLEHQALRKSLREISTNDYKSGHWPGVENPLGHVRLSDRTGADGAKNLLVEEVQSDVHNQAHSEGYRAPQKEVDAAKADATKARIAYEDAERENTKMIEDIRKLRFEMNDAAPRVWRIYDRDDATKILWESEPGADSKGVLAEVKRLGAGPNQMDNPRIYPPEQMAKLLDLQNAYSNHAAEKVYPAKQAARDAEAKASELSKGKIWSAPFKKSHTELLVKKVLAYAVEHGYDRVVFTTGEQQAKRFSLDTHLQWLRYGKEHEGTYWIEGMPKGASDGDGVSHQGVKEEDLQKYVGKEIADRIKAKEGKRISTGARSFGEDVTPAWELSGKGLEIIDQGKRQTYDVIIPSALNKIGSKHGSKVGREEISLGDGSRDLNYDDIASTVTRIDTLARVYSDKFSALPEETRNEVARYRARLKKGEDPVVVAADELSDEAAVFLGATKSGDKPKTATVHSFPITPELRRSIKEEGLPFYQRGQEPGLGVDETHKLAKVSLTPAQRLKHAKDIRRLVRQAKATAPQAKALIVNYLLELDKEGGVLGAHRGAAVFDSPVGPLIVMALNTKEGFNVGINNTAWHESGHILSKLGMIRKDELAAIDKMAAEKNLRGKYNIESRYRNSSEAVKAEETRMEWIGAHLGDNIEHYPPLVRNALRRIKTFIRQMNLQIKRWRGQDVQLDEILDKIASGEMGWRKPERQGGGDEALMQTEDDASRGSIGDRLKAAMGKPEMKPLLDELRGMPKSEVIAAARDLGIRSSSGKDSHIQMIAGKSSQAERDAFMAEYIRHGEPPDKEAFHKAYMAGTLKKRQSDEPLMQRDGELPIDFDERMYRASNMGFDTTKRLFHLTKKDFDEFKLGSDPTSHTGGGAIWLRPDPRHNVSAHQVYNWDTEGAREVPVFARLTKEVHPSEYAKLGLNSSFPTVVTKEEGARLSAAGYTHAMHSNGNEYAIFNPSDIRSVHARFDPAQEKSSNILMQRSPETDTPEFKRFFGKSQVLTPDKAPLRVYHSTNEDFEKFGVSSDIGYHFGTAEQANDRADVGGTTFDPTTKQYVAVGSRVLPVYLRIEKPLRLPDLATWEPHEVLMNLHDQGVINDKEFATWKDSEDIDIPGIIKSKGYDGVVYRNSGEATRKSNMEDLAGAKAQKHGGKNNFYPWEVVNRDGDRIGLGRTETDAWDDARNGARAGDRDLPSGDSYIVFDPRQVKSAFNRGTFDPAERSFMLQRGDKDEQTSTEAFKKWFGRGAVVNDDGTPMPVYHTTVAAGFDQFKRRANDIGIHFGTAEQARDRFDLKIENDPHGPSLRDVSHATMKVYLNLKRPLRLNDIGAWDPENLIYGLDRAGVLPIAKGRELLRDHGNQSGRIAALRRIIEQKGYDGIVYKNTGETGGGADLRRAKNAAFSALHARFPRKNSFSVEDQATPEYQAWRAADESYRKHREDNAEDSYIVFDPRQVKSAIGNKGTFDPSERSFMLQRGDKDEQTSTEAFKKWFGDWQHPKAHTSRAVGPVSAVIDRNMKPMRVYHATKNDVETFESGRESTNDYGFFGPVKVKRHGFFFSNNPKFSETFVAGEAGANVMPVYLSIKKPFHMDGNSLSNMIDTPEAERLQKDHNISVRGLYNMDEGGRWEAFDDDSGKEFVKDLKAAGYDGASFKEWDRDSGEQSETWVVFDSEQVKSAIGNKGTFDPKNKSIMFQRAEELSKDPAFRKFINGSIARDEGGTAIPLYHGTDRVVNQFGRDRDVGDLSHIWTYLSDNPKFAEKFSYNDRPLKDELTAPAPSRKGMIAMPGEKAGAKMQEVDGWPSGADGLVITRKDDTDKHGFALTHEKSGYAITQSLSYGEAVELSSRIADTLPWAGSMEDVYAAPKAKKASVAKEIKKLKSERVDEVAAMFGYKQGATGIGEGSNIMPVFASIKNPIDLRGLRRGPHDSPKKMLDTMREQGVDLKTSDLMVGYRHVYQMLNIPEFAQKVKDAAVKAGKDGIVFNDEWDKKLKGTSYIAFESGQIKGAFNRGTFDSNNPNIMFQRGDAKKPDATHVMDITRRERLTGNSIARKSDAKAKAEVKIEDGVTMPRKQIDALVAQKITDTRRRFPDDEKGGWQTMWPTSIKVSPGGKSGVPKVDIVWKAEDGYNLTGGYKRGTPQYAARVVRASEAGLKEVRALIAKADAGDENAITILRQLGWYREVTKKAYDAYGGSAPVVFDALSATSPNTTVESNYAMTQDGMPPFSRGDYDAQLARLTDEMAVTGSNKAPDDIKIRKPNGALFGMSTLNLMRAFQDRWATLKIGQAPKARQFSGNLSGRDYKSTSDVWDARNKNRLLGQRRVPIPAEEGVSGELDKSLVAGGDFGFAQDVNQHMVDAMNKSGELKSRMDAMGYGDLLPMDFQALNWFMEKYHWGENAWTSAVGEGGSFEQQMDLDPLNRHMAGFSIQTTEPPSDAAMAAVRTSLEKVIGADKDVRMFRVHPTRGEYGTDVERSFDMEISAKPGWNADPWKRHTIELAKQNGQKDVFFSERLSPAAAATNDNARPGIEIYLRGRVPAKRMEAIKEVFTSRGIDGFTMVTEHRLAERQMGGKEPDSFHGIRLQIVPEISMNFDDALRTRLAKDPAAMDKYLDEQQIHLQDALNELKTKPGFDDIIDARLHHYDTEVIHATEYDDFLSQADQQGSGTNETGPGAGGGFRSGGLTSGENAARRDRALGERGGGQDLQGALLRTDELTAPPAKRSKKKKASGTTSAVDKYLDGDVF